MRSLFSPFSLLVCLLFVLACVTRNNYEEHEEKRRKRRKRRNFLVFGFAAFGAISLFLSLSLSFFLSLSLLSPTSSLFSREKKTRRRASSHSRRACAEEENSFQNCVLVVVINLSFPSSSLDSFFSRGGVLWKKRVTFIWDVRTRLWKTRSERRPVLLLLRQLILQLLPFAVSIVLVHWGI